MSLTFMLVFKKAVGQDQCTRSRKCQRKWGQTKWLADQGLIKGIEYEKDRRGKTSAKDAT